MPGLSIPASLLGFPRLRGFPGSIAEASPSQQRGFREAHERPSRPREAARGSQTKTFRQGAASKKSHGRTGDPEFSGAPLPGSLLHRRGFSVPAFTAPRHERPSRPREAAQEAPRGPRGPRDNCERREAPRKSARGPREAKRERPREARERPARGLREARERPALASALSGSLGLAGRFQRFRQQKPSPLRVPPQRFRQQKPLALGGPPQVPTAKTFSFGGPPSEVPTAKTPRFRVCTFLPP